MADSRQAEVVVHVQIRESLVYLSIRTSDLRVHPWKHEHVPASLHPGSIMPGVEMSFLRVLVPRGAMSPRGAQLFGLDRFGYSSSWYGSPLRPLRLRGYIAPCKGYARCTPPHSAPQLFEGRAGFGGRDRFLYPPLAALDVRANGGDVPSLRSINCHPNATGQGRSALWTFESLVAC